MPSEEYVEQLVVIDPEDLYEARRAASENGVDVQEMTVVGIEPVTTVTLLLMGSSLAVGAVLYILDRRKGGQVIDLRPGAPRMLFRSKDLIYGLVMIVTAEGKVEIEVKEPKGMFGGVVDSLKGILTDLSKAGVEEIVAAVKGAVGDAATVTHIPAEQ